MKPWCWTLIFVKAYSRRDPHENSRGKSDPEARVGRNGKTYELGYKLHVAADAKSELPLAVIVASANENEKKHAPVLFRKALKATEQRTKTLVADSQFSSRKLREQLSTHGVRAVIPYPANQSKGEAKLLRVTSISGLMVLCANVRFTLRGEPLRGLILV